MSALFTRLEKAAPKLPGITCPIIDGALDDLSDALGLLDHLPMDVAMTAWNILAELRDDDGKLERIRAANEQLRRAAIYWRLEARKLAGVVTDAEWTHIVR